MSDFFDVVEGRRSVRRFFSHPVSDDDVYKVLSAGHAAPAAGNIVNWDLIVVESEEARLKISGFCNGQFWMSEAPVHVVVCSRTKELESVYGSRGRVYALQNTAAVVENMLLAAHSLGLSACWVGSFDERELKELLSVPVDVEVHAVVVIGYGSVIPPKPARDSLDRFVFFEKYGKNEKY